MSSSSSKAAAAAAAGAMGGKGARACDSCLRRRARWYCAADDAFLCQACDASVHSANPLARRHDRLRLHATTSSSKCRQVAPAWSKRKARSRRPHVKSVGQLLSRKLVVFVPDDQVADADGATEEEEEEQLLYRVPSFDRALAELCSPPTGVDDAAAAASCFRENVDVDDGAVENAQNNKDPVVAAPSSPVQQLPDSLVARFGPTDAELREFAADMEALLGHGLDDGNELDESFYMESQLAGFTTPVDEDDDGRVKMELDHGAMSNRSDIGFGRAEMMMKPELSAEVLDIDFNYCSPAVVDDDDDDDSFEQMKAITSASNGDAADAQFLRRSLDLRLNYESVIESWGSSPWTDGQRPDVQLDDFWPQQQAYHSGAWTAGGGGRPGGEPVLVTPLWGADGGREARVSRYREKRRTRLFAKKIRYEVRKLNAEKRPRMKGRFVKRPATGGGGGAAPCGVT